MKNLLRSKAALSTVVTTLIILVVSVLLATVVTFYAINVTTTRVQEESLQITKLHTWHDGTEAVTAFYMVNTGGRDVVLEKIAVRGIAAPVGDVYFVKPADPLTADLPFIAVADILTENPVGTELLAAVAGTNLILASGESMIVYVTNPGQVSVNDIGVTIGVTVFTANAQYYKESNVEAGA